MKQLNLNKVLSTSLSLALAVTSAPMPARAAGPVGPAAPAFVSRLTPPEQFGYVASSFAPHNENKPRLIVIADLHAHVEVQRHIMAMLEDLVPKIKGQSDKKVPVFLEGGWEANLEEPLRGISDPQTRVFMNEYYLQKAELAGPQAYSEKIAGTNQVSMIGVEDKEEYLANKAMFAKSYPVRRQLLEALKIQEAAMQILADNVEGRSFQKIKAMRDDYNAGRISPERYAKILIRYSDRFHIQSHDVSVLQNVGSANSNELDLAFANIYREVSTRLSEKRPMTAFLREQLGNEANIRVNLAKVDADLDLLKRLVADQLTPSEVGLAVKRMGDLVRIGELLLKNQPVEVNVREAIRQSLEFYPFAFLRDENLIKNSLASLEKFGPESTGILVAGGFHTEAIADYLAKHQVAYMIVHPVITRDLTSEEQLNYVKRMCGDHVTAQELESDIAWIQSGRQKAMDAVSSGVPVTATHQGTKPAGSDGTTDPFLGGLSQKMRDALRKGGKVLATALVAIGASATPVDPSVFSPADVSPEVLGARLSTVQRDLNSFAAEKSLPQLTLNQSLPGITLELNNKDGKYYVMGQKDLTKRNSFADLANAYVAASPAGTAHPQYIYVQSVQDLDALKSLDAEGRMIHAEGSETATMPIMISRFLALDALNNGAQPAKNSKQEVAASRAAHLISHELTELNKGIGEKTTTALGYALGASFANSYFQEGGASRFVSHVAPQLAAGAEAPQVLSTRNLARKVSGIFKLSDGAKARTVQDLARTLAGEFDGASQEDIVRELTAMEGSIDLDVALYTGVTAPVKKRLHQRFLAMLATGMSA